MLWIVGYVICALVTVPRVYRFMAKEMGDDDAEDQMGNAILSVLLSALWPLMWAAALVRRIMHPADRQV